MVRIIEDKDVLGNLNSKPHDDCAPCALKDLCAKKDEDAMYDAMYEEYKQQEAYRLLVQTRQSFKLK